MKTSSKTPAQKKVNEKAKEIQKTSQNLIDSAVKEGLPASHLKPVSTESDLRKLIDEINKIRVIMNSSNDTITRKRRTYTSSSSSGIPQSVISTLLNNNQKIVKCFKSHRQTEGNLPTNIIVKFMVSASGKSISPKVVKGTYSGKKFPKCISSVIRDISFPPNPNTDKTYYHVFSI